MRVPTTPTAVIVPVCSTTSPRVRKHTTDVTDAHDVVPQSQSPSLDVGVVSRLAPKLTPDTVTLHPVVMQALKLSTKLTVGAGVGRGKGCGGGDTKQGLAGLMGRWRC